MQFNIPDASDAVRSLIEVHLGLKEHSLWEAGWNLDVNNNSDVPNMNSKREVTSIFGKLTIIVLLFMTNINELPSIQ